MWGHQTNICKFTSLNPSQVPVSFSQGASSRFSKNSSQDTPTFIGIIFILFMNKEGWNYIISPFEILIFREWYNWIMLTSLELTNPNKNLVSFEYSRLCVTIRRGLTIRRFSKLINCHANLIIGFLFRSNHFGSKLCDSNTWFCQVQSGDNIFEVVDGLIKGDTSWHVAWGETTWRLSECWMWSLMWGRDVGGTRERWQTQQW